MIVAFPSRITAGAGVAPERLRVVIIGAGAAGITAALHIGEHSVLLEQRAQVGADLSGCEAQGGFDDRKSSLPLGASRVGVTRDQDRGADRQRQGVPAWERQAVARACTPGDREAGGEAHEAGESLNEPRVVARWIPPRFEPADDSSGDADSRESLESLLPLLRGDLRLRARVIRIAPAAHLVELDDGRTIVYDKLISSVESIELIGLLQPELPSRIRSHQGLMYWLAARDIELVDDSTQFLFGDVNPFAAGRRVAETVKRALAQKFRPASETFLHGEQLFKPRLVRTPLTTAAVH
ncbi:MAG: hypothetical protein ABI821_05610 [Pseudomonadota bacterium]